MVPANVRREHPVHPAGNVGSGAGLNDKMHVIRHQARGKDWQFEADLGTRNQ
jgi:hypothetical protein